VNEKGDAVQLQGTEYAQDYWASVVLLHLMREGDRKLSVKKLIEKYPYKKPQKIAQEGWEEDSLRTIKKPLEKGAFLFQPENDLMSVGL